MVREEKHHFSLIDNIFKGFIALIVLIASSYMIIVGLNDPDKYVSVNTAFEIWAGGVFFFSLPSTLHLYSEELCKQF